MSRIICCEKCDAPTDNSPNDFDEVFCSDCEQNAAEAAWERFCGDFYGGADPLTIREQQIHTWKNRP